MPKIDAPTVAEHHARRRAALVRAAIDLLAAGGAAAVTPAAVGAEAGLARSSVYQYFPSGAALLAAVVEESVPPAVAALRESTAGASTPRARVESYLRAALDLALTDAHRAAVALAGADLPEPCRVRLAELHREMAAPLLDAVRDLGTPDPEITTLLLSGLVESAVRAVEMGLPGEAVIERTLALAAAGLEGAEDDVDAPRSGEA